MTTTNKPLGIYVHIPYCVRKCPYCGFYSVPLGTSESKSCGLHTSSGNSVSSYIERLKSDIKEFSRSYSEGRFVDSIFFGGGTPTAVESESIIDVLATIREEFRIPCDSEISIESNPGTVAAPADFEKYLDAGFNRLSIGVQSFDDEVLSTLGRIHTGEEAERAYHMAREAGFRNINLDLMFGIPGQSMKVWEKTLRKALELRPEHISFYSLQIEEDTVYYDRFQRGEIVELPDELNRAMYHNAIRMLTHAGYKHYEISNASAPGFECRHNIKYWTLKEYIGIGASASSYIDGRRLTFKPDIEAYERGGDERLSLNQLNTEFDDMSEYTFTGLRLTRGINYGEFKSRFGIGFREAFQDRWHELDEFFASGALKEYVNPDGSPAFIKLSEEGLDISNKIMAVFV